MSYFMRMYTWACNILYIVACAYTAQLRCSDPWVCVDRNYFTHDYRMLRMPGALAGGKAR